MVVMTPALAAFTLKTLPDLAALMGLTIGGKKGKKIAKQAGVLKGLFEVPELIGGAFGSPSKGTSTTSETPETPEVPDKDTGLQIGHSPPLGLGKGKSYNDASATLAEWLWRQKL